MKQCLTVCAPTIGMPAPAHYADAQALTPAQRALKANVEGVPDIPYEAAPNFLKLSDDLYFGESVGVATNSKGHTFVYDRGHRTRIFEFDQTGKFHVAWDETGNIYVSDGYGNARERKDYREVRNGGKASKEIRVDA